MFQFPNQGSLGFLAGDGIGRPPFQQIEKPAMMPPNDQMMYPHVMPQIGQNYGNIIGQPQMQMHPQIQDQMRRFQPPQMNSQIGMNPQMNKQSQINRPRVPMPNQKTLGGF